MENKVLKGAGFNIQAIHNGCIYVLLGRDNYLDGMWSGFGGSIQKKLENSLECAFREVEEETKGLITKSEMLSWSPNRYHNFGNYRMYGCEIKYDPSLPERFQQQSSKPEYKSRKFREKSELRWFRFFAIPSIKHVRGDLKKDYKEILEDPNIFFRITQITGLEECFGTETSV